jgi:hypothetical protein
MSSSPKTYSGENELHKIENWDQFDGQVIVEVGGGPGGRGGAGGRAAGAARGVGRAQVVGRLEKPSQAPIFVVVIVI